MHNVEISQEIVDRVLARHQRYHLFDSLDPAKTAFVIVDMQNTFCQEGSPAEVPESRGICDEINAFNAELRKLGVKIVWVTHANTGDGERSDWDNFFNVFVADEVRQRTIESLAPGKEVRLKHAYLVTCDEVITDDDGTVVELRCSYDPESRGGEAPVLRDGCQRFELAQIHVREGSDLFFRWKVSPATTWQMTHW